MQEKSVFCKVEFTIFTLFAFFLSNYLAISKIFCTFASKFKNNIIMTDKQLKRAVAKRTREMINESARHMKKNLERAFNSGGINLSDYEDNNILPRIIITALLKEEMSQYPPIRKEDEKTASNLFLLL